MQRTVLLTGASRGIGRSIARRLLNDGHRLSLGLRDPKALRGTDLDVEMVLHHAYDASDPASADSWVGSTVRHWGAIDTLIHCAGILHRTPLLFSDGEEQQLDELWAINVKGPWWLTRAAWPFLVTSGHGRIQVLVSMSGKRVKGRMAGYPVSKFALMGLCQSMRNEGWDKGIRVTCICPSWVNTEMASSVTAVEPAEMTQPEDLASLSSSLLLMPNAAVPFELAMNCSLET
ncbi:SDR family NAD(P)-dependent oxidoreductase [Synechococcus sp. YX-04-1]|uniref:SDR family NAD(P)-dependent oxidoreductase n=1 Tax=Synechococcus sp. YX-04-1 TaxID=3062778 RepID=UPI0026E3EED8|nr:SDR family NAD(P)-dependent oxidoreductase [Synechococcus sp. YX-04-1]MDO6351686.1 SDR family NAD(P)-dependent oxidoreductase [Synechococcus sp. YX-04-1]